MKIMGYPDKPVASITEVVQLFVIPYFCDFFCNCFVIMKKFQFGLETTNIMGSGMTGTLQSR